MSTRSRPLTRVGSLGKAAQQMGLSLSALAAGQRLVSAQSNIDTREEHRPLRGTRVHMEGRGGSESDSSVAPKGLSSLQ